MTALPPLPDRPVDAHKGHFGRVLVVGGSVGMAGAPALAALAALRSGAGLVRVACPPEIRGTVATLVPCATLGGLRDNDRYRPTVRAVGPGAGDTLVQDLPWILQDRDTPAVIDADGLNTLANMKQWWTALHQRCVLTPHPGEFARLLTGTAIPAGQERPALARALAERCGAVVVLKGHHTVVCAGDQVFVNDTGNAGMATAGSGDVLTGMIAAWIAQGMAPFEAACLGVYLHGVAGDLAAGDFGEISMIATDIIDALPEAIQGYARKGTPPFSGFSP